MVEVKPPKGMVNMSYEGKRIPVGGSIQIPESQLESFLARGFIKVGSKTPPPLPKVKKDDKR